MLDDQRKGLRVSHHSSERNPRVVKVAHQGTPDGGPGVVVRVTQYLRSFHGRPGFFSRSFASAHAGFRGYVEQVLKRWPRAEARCKSGARQGSRQKQNRCNYDIRLSGNDCEGKRAESKNKNVDGDGDTRETQTSVLH